MPQNSTESNYVKTEFIFLIYHFIVIVLQVLGKTPPVYHLLPKIVRIVPSRRLNYRKIDSPCDILQFQNLNNSKSNKSYVEINSHS